MKHLPAIGVAVTLGIAALGGGLWLRKPELLVLSGINFVFAAGFAFLARR
jgi:hypothetical protein